MDSNLELPVSALPWLAVIAAHTDARRHNLPSTFDQPATTTSLSRQCFTEPNAHNILCIPGRIIEELWA